MALACLAALAGPAQAASAPPKIALKTLVSTGASAPGGGTLVAGISAPVLDRDFVVFRAATSQQSEPGLYRFRRSSGTWEAALVPGQALPDSGGVVDVVAEGPNAHLPAMSSDDGQIAVAIELDLGAGAKPVRAIAVQSDTGWDIVAALGGSNGTSVPGPWPEAGEYGWNVSDAVANELTVMAPPFPFSDAPTRPTIFGGRVLFSGEYEGRLLFQGDSEPLVETALVRTAPTSLQLVKLADPWFPAPTEATPEGAPVLRRPRGGWAGKGVIVWLDLAETDSVAWGGMVEDHRLRVAAGNSLTTLTRARVLNGVDVTGDVTPGALSHRFARFATPLSPWAPVVNREAQRVAFWAESLPTLYAPGTIPKLQQGIYRAELPSGLPFSLVDTLTVVPGFPGVKYGSFAGPSIWGNRVVVTAAYTPFDGQTRVDVLAIDGARRRRVLGTGDIHDGKTVKAARTSQQAQHNDSVAMVVSYTDGSEALVLADVDVPCASDITGSTSPQSPMYGVPDGIRNRQDLEYYQARYAAAHLEADVTSTTDAKSPYYGVPDGAITIVDWLYFRHEYYLVGCK